ncbi:adhesin [Neisseria meningitidis]|uniref:YadA C-terminal domain-containing protein n=1 Tax=Neisseria meningitidis TaxID=487 RepID=UPI001C5B8299|nr:YadA C-terminal domain-containing protein [Neisseria meningitidis]MBW3888271.1 adhesin [Neisseria meningitidis]
MKHFQSKVLTAAILAALSGSAMADNAPTADEIAKAALVNSYNITQEINGFKVGDTIYDIGENNQITSKEATEDEVKADDFGGLGLKEVVAEHDQSLADLTETVNENSEALVKTAEVVNEISTDVKANKAAIEENKAAITTKADKAKLDEVSGKVTANETAIATKANSADVYTKTQSDERFVRIDTSIGGLTTTADGLDTRLKTAEKTITEHGTRLNGLDKTVSDLRKETRQGLAEQAALSGLFQPYNVGRFNVTAAVGGYKSESAVAIGTGFRFTENFAAKAGVAVGTSSGSSAAYHVGVNYEW